MSGVALGALQAIAATQGCLFSFRQAQACGIDGKTLARWRERGWIRWVRRGVYAFAGAPASRWEAVVAAALAAGSEAVVSHRSAAAIHRFPGVTIGNLPELTVHRDRNLRLQGVEVHRVGPVTARDAVERRGVQVTSMVRTVVDLAPYVDSELLGAILDEGLVRRWWSVPDIYACLDRQSTWRHGSRPLRRLLAVRRTLPVPDSHLEQRVFGYLRPLQPFRPHYHQDFDGVLVILDAAWPCWKAAVEIDGRSYRAMSRSAHDRESRKLNALAANHWSVAHLTATMTPDECLRAALAVLPADAFPDLRLKLGCFRATA